ncbi:hypothetical protein F443_22617 [Phytophthora nicotianae P1569]|uniref:Uncharacterized protein n=1 Tax=Phytophthora nicotianae P1569 TaxID=1317065 RepID=V9DW63_PHYNI|nr:hypothetical protein F443_22617 [Phytophthora nicotianae P1569]
MLSLEQERMDDAKVVSRILEREASYASRRTWPEENNLSRQLLRAFRSR